MGMVIEAEPPRERERAQIARDQVTGEFIYVEIRKVGRVERRKKERKKEQVLFT